MGRSLKSRFSVWLKYYLPLRFWNTVNRLDAGKRRLPDFLIIGAEKGGTTSLFDYLNQHPDVKMSRVKEPAFFSGKYKKGLSYYKTYFPKKAACKLTGEASPYYFFHPHVPERVKRDLPNVKIIVLLRDPVMRSYSHYQMNKRMDPAPDFETALKLEHERISMAHEQILTNPDYINDDHQAFSYVEKSKYATQLKRWFRHFDKEHFLILKSEEFFAEPSKTMSAVFSFLDLQDHDEIKYQASNSRTYDLPDQVIVKRLRDTLLEDTDELKRLLGSKFSWDK